MMKMLLPTSGTAWCFVWLPTFLYFLYTRVYSSWTVAGYAKAGDSSALANHFQMVHDKDCAAIANILYLALPCSDTPTQEERQQSSSHLLLRQALYLLWNAQESATTTANNNYNNNNNQSSPPQGGVLLTHTVWRHDPETGRGAILVAQANDEGRVWQWETGGGPIPIGRTLVLDQAGCRSTACLENRKDRPALSGVGSLATTAPSSKDKASALIVAEWGEQRIVRLEEETGARTPLVINVPLMDDICRVSTTTTAKQRLSSYGTASNKSEEEKSDAKASNDEKSIYKPTISWQRLQAPRSMYVTNHGELFFLDQSHVDCMILWQRKAIHKIPPLASLAVSRRAHEWTTLSHDDDDDNDKSRLNFRVIFTAHQAVGGLAVVEDSVVPSSCKILVTTTLPKEGVVILEIPVDDDDDDDDDEMTARTPEPRIIFRLQRYLPTALEPGPLLITPNRKTIFLATNEGIAVLLPSDNRDDDYRLIGLLHMPIMDRPRITSLTLGQDSYLYVTTESRLWRIKVQD